MTQTQRSFAPAADVRQAPFVDIERFLKRENKQPRTITQVAQRVDLFGSMARSLASLVGTAEALERLDSSPDVDADFDWSGIADHDRQRVKVLVDLISSDSPIQPGDGEDSVYEGLDIDPSRFPWNHPEYRTIAWRLLRILALDPERPLDRRIKPERITAAIVWIALTASGGLSNRTRWKPRHLWDWFGVTPCTKLGRQLAAGVRRLSAANGESCDDASADNTFAPADLILGDAKLLHSTFRSLLLDHRSGVLDHADEQHRATRENHPFRLDSGKGQFGLSSRPVTVRWAMRGEQSDTGRSHVSVVLGDGFDDMEVLAVSIPDARRLIEAIQFALAAPV